MRKLGLKYNKGDEVDYKGNLAKIMAIDDSVGTVFPYRIVLLEGWITAHWVMETELNVFNDLVDVCIFLRKEINR